MPCRHCTRAPRHSLAWWAGLVALGAGLETAALRHHHREHTASHFIRSVFAMDRTAGKRAFVAAWVALSAWLVPHLLNGGDQS